MLRLPNCLSPALPLLLAALLTGCSSSEPAAQRLPAPLQLYGLTEGGELVTFDLGAANKEMPQPTVRPLNGLGSEILVDIDVRPGDGELYGITARGAVYHLQPRTGEAVADGASAARPTVAMDFDPAGGRLRVLGASGELSRLTLRAAPQPPTSATPLTDDGPVAYPSASTLPAQLVALAHSQSYDVHSSGAYPAQAPALYSIDAARDALLLHQGGPQFGRLGTVAVLGQDAQVGRTGFDISGADVAYVSLSDGQDTSLYVTALTPPPAGTGQLLRPVTTLRGLSLRGIALSLPAR